MSERLSDQQARILATARDEARTRGDGIAMIWRQEGTSRSESASRSRALKRLEDRGLLRRIDYGFGSGRTLAVKLTDEGRAVADRLTQEPGTGS